ncbi:hypothetical protein CDO52_23985 [Nocardiopsis gilva YIM 90087]|uniref:Uncharacterized protein n=1 Tax=Nocardiopsis gilva YIM 90087 TaxID=1235441 RepID=A0A223SBA5_9ACTN|nr:hypothetical protein CDO52_23985 [Nocardiopsis gilva YIM 90087]
MLPAAAHEGAAHFGPGDDGTPKLVNAPLDDRYFLIAAIPGAPGLIVMVVGLVLFLSGRKARTRSLAGAWSRLRAPRPRRAAVPGPHERRSGAAAHRCGSAPTWIAAVRVGAAHPAV